MPPSHVIYLVSETRTGIPVAAFTAEVEMQVWLYNSQHVQDLVRLRGWQVRDSAYWHGKTPEPFPVDLIYQYRQGEKLVKRRSARNRSWE